MIMTNSNNYTKICPGGGLIIAWQLKNKRVLLVGGGNVAAGACRSLRPHRTDCPSAGRLINVKDADAHLTVLCPQGGLCAEMRFRIEDEKSVDVYLDKSYEGEQDIEGYDMVLTAIDDAETSRTICQVARKLRIPVNVADVPPECDFYFGSLIRRGPLQVMVSTGGKGPRLAANIRALIEEALPNDIGKAIENVGVLRSKLRRKAPEPQQGAKRMRWMIGVCDKWSTDDLATLSEEDMTAILQGWDENGKVYTPRQVRGISWNPWQSIVHARKSLFQQFPLAETISPWAGGMALGAATTLAIFSLRTR